MAQIEIIGNDNYVLIDDNFKNTVLGQKATINFPVPSDANVKGSVTTFSYTPQGAVNSPPLIAVNSSFPVTVQTMFRSGNTYTWTLVCSSAGRGGSVEAYIFHLPEAVPDAGGMVQLFNAQGVLVFDSNLKYSKVERALAHTLDGGESIAVAPGRKYAAVTSKGAGAYNANNYPPLTRPPLYGVSEIQERSGCYMQNGIIGTQKFIFTDRIFATTSPNIGSFEKLTGMLLIFDVTGM